MKNTISIKTENGLLNLVQNEPFGTIHINALENGKPYQNICHVSNQEFHNIISSYIDKEALLKELNRYEKELHEEKREAIECDDEMVLLAICNQENAINHIKRYVMHSIPTVIKRA